jgi:2'-5' RNA ligase
MSKLVAVDVAILPPADVSERAIQYSAALPDDGPHGLRLDTDHLPHITLTQLFIRADELDTAFERIDPILRRQPPLDVLVTGGGGDGHNVSMTVERTPELAELHEQLMEALRGVERSEGTHAAFLDGEGRVGDVLWVSGYRLKSSFGHFAPHITLGHGTEAPVIEPFTFDASTVAACHLGRFCTCRRILRSWSLGA